AIVDPAYQDPALEKTTTETAGSTDDFHRHVSNASRHREEHRLDDNLQLLRAEQKNRTDQHEKASTLGRTRSRREVRMVLLDLLPEQNSNACRSWQRTMS